MNFGEQIWCVLSEEIRLKLLHPCGPMLTKPKNKKNGRTPKVEISKFCQLRGTP